MGLPWGPKPLWALGSLQDCGVWGLRGLGLLWCSWRISGSPMSGGSWAAMVQLGLSTRPRQPHTAL